jgi:RNA polymerase sigma-70 factor (sigma-E family)
VERAVREAEFSEYFRSRAAHLRRLAYALCGDWHTAEDLTQSTFVALYRRWGTVREATADAYARRTLVNTFLSHRRGRRRELVVAETPDRPSTSTGDPAMRVDIGRALAALTPQQRAVVVLRHLEDLPVSEVAEILGMAEGSVKSQTSRAVEALRRHFPAELTSARSELASPAARSRRNS